MSRYLKLSTKKPGGDLDWTLNAYLVGLVCLTTLISFGAIAVVSLGIRIPTIERESREMVIKEADEVIRSQDLILQSVEERLKVLAQAVSFTQANQVPNLLRPNIGEGVTFAGLYLLDDKGRQLAGSALNSWKSNVLDQSALHTESLSIIQTALAAKKIVWSSSYASAIAGRSAIAVAVPAGSNQVLLAEVPYEHVMQGAFQMAGVSELGRKSSTDVTLIDSQSHVIGDTSWSDVPELRDWAKVALVQRSKRKAEPSFPVEFDGQTFVVALKTNDRLQWTVLVRSPRGLDNPRVMAWVWLLVGGCFGALATGLLLSRWWAVQLGDSIHGLVQQASDIANGTERHAWPEGPVREFNQLSFNLASMSEKLKERQQHFQAIFDISPVPLVVYDFGRDQVLDLNRAACLQFGIDRESWLCKSGRDLPIWPVDLEPEWIDPRLLEGKTIEAELRHADGNKLICLLTVRALDREHEGWQVWALQDVTQARNNEHELRLLNEELERRVEERTEALQKANAEASQAIDRMHETRDYLVRSEKMAALGGLVAGVAHELNTPLGNSLMAVSTLGEETKVFKNAMSNGLKKSTLDAWIACVDKATSISTRNLSRAADLVSSFKQVAVDQSSARRRKFKLDELVTEITITLQPSYLRLPIRFEVDIEKGVVIDSYPGHLGQVLTNLISNAIVHAFEDGRAGVIRIVGRAIHDGLVRLQVTDNGKGIPDDLLGRIFDPFVTTRMGRGGTGLGLNIAFNAATHVLGGEIQVTSEVGKGTSFTVVFPKLAPNRAEVSKDDVQTWL